MKLNLEHKISKRYLLNNSYTKKTNEYCTSYIPLPGYPDHPGAMQVRKDSNKNYTSRGFSKGGKKTQNPNNEESISSQDNYTIKEIQTIYKDISQTTFPMTITHKIQERNISPIIVCAYTYIVDYPYANPGRFISN